jgi:hypothetical protein
MSTFMLRGNTLSGPLPLSVLLSWPNLVWMDFSQNQLSGPVDARLADPNQLPALSLVYLSHNQLSGTIDPSFGSSPSITALDLSSNHMTGTIAESFKGNTVRQFLFLRDNMLTGAVDFKVILGPKTALIDLSEATHGREHFRSGTAKCEQLIASSCISVVYFLPTDLAIYSTQ